MTLSLSGIRIKKINMERNNEGKLEINGTYELISSKDTVLATQSFNGYSDAKLNLSADGIHKMNVFYDTVKNELETILGFTKE